MSGNRQERRGARDPEEYLIFLTDPDRIAKPLMDENERVTSEFDQVAVYLERLGYEVRIETY